MFCWYKLTFFMDVYIGKVACYFVSMTHGIVIVIGFVATTFSMNYIYSQRSLKLYLIDVVFYIVVFALMGMIMRLL